MKRVITVVRARHQLLCCDLRLHASPCKRVRSSSWHAVYCQQLLAALVDHGCCQ
jgi:hypothetical protein